MEQGPHDGDLCILLARESAAGQARCERRCAAAEGVGRVGHGARQADEETRECDEAPGVGADVVAFEVVILEVLVSGRAEPCTGGTDSAEVNEGRRQLPASHPMTMSGS